MVDRSPDLRLGVSADGKAHPEKAGVEFGLLGAEEVQWPQVTFMSCSADDHIRLAL